MRMKHADAHLSASPTHAGSWRSMLTHAKKGEGFGCVNGRDVETVEDEVGVMMVKVVALVVVVVAVVMMTNKPRSDFLVVKMHLHTYDGGDDNKTIMMTIMIIVATTVITSVGTV